MSCNKNKSAEEKSSSSHIEGNQEEDKDLDTFIDKFCADKEFQLSRVKFPVGSHRYKMHENCSEESPSYDVFENVCISEIPMNSENWKFITKDLLSVYKPDKEGAFADWTEKTELSATFDIGWVESELLSRMKFYKIGGKWYLTEYFDSTIYD